MLAAGNYALLKDRAGSLPLEYYVYPAQMEDAQICFSKTADMITFFNEKIGFPMRGRSMRRFSAGTLSSAAWKTPAPQL